MSKIKTCKCNQLKVCPNCLASKFGSINAKLLNKTSESSYIMINEQVFNKMKRRHKNFAQAFYKANK